MHKQFLPQTAEGKLAHIIEECAEVTKVCAKIQRFGMSSKRPFDGKVNSELLVEELIDLEEALKAFKPYIPRPSDARIYDEVMRWFEASEVRAQEEFKCAKFKELSSFHHSLGRNIRNHFKLWAYHWEPEIKEGVDYSPEHPDAVSQRIIEKVWRELQNES